MRYDSFETFLTEGAAALAKGPVGLILAEDAVEVDTTIRHHLDQGFRSLIVFAAPELELPARLDDKVTRVDCDPMADGALETIVNGCIDAAPGVWFYYCYNAEYLFYPFCETRSVGEMISFNMEERRDAILTYVIDLYAGDLWSHPTAVSLEDAHLDRSGYYALARTDRWNNPAERQLDFFGGLRWRFEEHIPAKRRRIDRISLFRAKPGLHLRADHTFDDPEYNTYACPWHNSLTASVCSFRTAKALKRNPGSTFDIQTFRWHNSAPFDWHSQQLLDLGLMEPGQWF
ncbi:MAG: hypothetical protein GW886_02920 [Rhodobacterales bacterium]|nr:hypothetical protein [Rhodobacterales bacterium]NCT12010.1 hypothetical protein [Rhodobacterales bacterium]